MPSAVPDTADTPIPALLNPGARRAGPARAALARDQRFAVTEVAPGRMADHVRAIAEHGTPVVLVAGGDGTLRQAAEVLRGSATALAVLPAGTRNHFARDLDIPLEMPAALELAATGHARAVDVASVNGRTIVNTSSVGAYVSYVRLRRTLDRWLGYHAASLAAGLVALRRHRRFAVTLELGGKHLRYEAALVFVGVGERSLERPVPGSRKRGGASALHVFVVHEPSRARVANLLMRAMTRGIPFLGDERGVHGFLVDACTVELVRRDGHVALDGELLPMQAPLRYRIERQALRVIAARARGMRG